MRVLLFPGDGKLAKPGPVPVINRPAILRSAAAEGRGLLFSPWFSRKRRRNPGRSERACHNPNEQNSRKPAHTVAELASARQHQGNSADHHGARGGG